MVLKKQSIIIFKIYVFKKMLSLLIDDEISGENNKKIKKLIKGYSKNYLSTLKIVNIDKKIK